MLNKLIRWSLANRAIVTGLSLLLLALGYQAVRELPVEVLPDLTKPTVVILTEAPGLAPEEVDSIRRSARPPVSLEMGVGEDKESEFGQLIADERAESPYECAAETLTQDALRDAVGDERAMWGPDLQQLWRQLIKLGIAVIANHQPFFPIEHAQAFAHVGQGCVKAQVLQPELFGQAPLLLPRLQRKRSAASFGTP